jgi:hypothetical protein
MFLAAFARKVAGGREKPLLAVGPISDFGTEPALKTCHLGY